MCFVSGSLMVKVKPGAGAHLRLDWGRIYFRAHVVVGRICFPGGGTVGGGGETLALCWIVASGYTQDLCPTGMFPCRLPLSNPAKAMVIKMEVQFYVT